MKDHRLPLNNKWIRKPSQIAENFNAEEVLQHFQNGQLKQFLDTGKWSAESKALTEIDPQLPKEELLQAIIKALQLDVSVVDRARKNIQLKELEKLEEQANSFYRDKAFEQAYLRAEHIEYKFPAQSIVAQRILGLCYLEGNGARKDVNEAFRFLKNAANQMDAEAQVAVGKMLLDGAGPIILKNGGGATTLKNERKAIEYFNLAANQGNSDALYILGCCHEQGRGHLEKNIDKAKHFYKLAAGKNNPDASYRLACLCRERGDFCSRSERLAWLKKAEKAGHLDAHKELNDLKSDRNIAKRVLEFAGYILTTTTIFTTVAQMPLRPKRRRWKIW